MNGGHYLGADAIRIEVRSTDLNHRGFAVIRKGQNGAEIKIMGEDDGVGRNGPGHDLFIARRRGADVRLVYGLKPRRLQTRDPARGQIHVHHYFHAAESGTSRSSARHAA